LVEAAYLPAAMALIADYHPSGSRATAIALHTSGLSFGLVAGGSLAGYLGQRAGWRFGFLLLGCSGLALAAIARRFLRDAAPLRAAPVPAAPAPQLFRPLARTPSYLFLVAAGMVAALGNNTFLNWLPLYFFDTFGMSLARAGFSGTFVVQGAAVLALILGGVVSDRVASRGPRRRMLIQIICALAAAPFLLVFFTRPQVWAVSAGVLCFSFCQKFGDANIAPLTCDLLPRRCRSTAFGLMNTANCLAGGVAVMTAGLLKRHFGLGGVFGMISATTLAFAGVLLPAYLFFLRRDLAAALAASSPP
jgi:predicted MFS family arabinose efflux permease